MSSFKYVFIGLSITSSWGNGHATTYRGLLRELAKRGHEIDFLERDKPWYSDRRDLPDPSFCRTALYSSLSELKDRFGDTVRTADLVIVGSYVPEGVQVGKWVLETAQGRTAFYDIDTPVTLAKLAMKDCEYLTPELIGMYDMYLSFSGGPVLARLERIYGSPMARPLYCSVDSEKYFPDENGEAHYDLGYMGTYGRDRQRSLETMMLEAARMWPDGRFIVAGPQYPEEISWPANVDRTEHLPPERHTGFYNNQRFTLNVTREDMKNSGFSPSVRLFEAAACGIPVISDYWKGLDEFFDLQREILISRTPAETLEYLRRLPESSRRRIGSAARNRVLTRHTAAHRAEEFEQYTKELYKKIPGRKEYIHE